MSFEGREWNFTVVGEQLGGMNAQVVGYWLRGEKYPLLAGMRKIEKVFGYKVGDQIMALPVDGGKDKVWAETLIQHIDAWWESQK